MLRYFTTAFAAIDHPSIVTMWKIDTMIASKNFDAKTKSWRLVFVVVRRLWPLLLFLDMSDTRWS